MPHIPWHQRLAHQCPYRYQQRLVHLVGTALGSKHVCALVHDVYIHLELREYIQRLMYLNTYEPEQTAWAREIVRPGDTVVDIGASFGWYTLLAAQLVGTTGQVWAFEPSPIAARRLRAALNNLSYVHLVQAAVGRTEQAATLYLPTTSAIHSPSLVASDPHFVPVSVRQVSLDNLAELHNRPIRLVKLDIEGYEGEALAGMRSLLKSGHIEHLICELNSGWLSRQGDSPSAVRALLQESGYLPYRETALLTDVPSDVVGETYTYQDVWFSRGTRHLSP